MGKRSKSDPHAVGGRAWQWRWNALRGEVQPKIGEKWAQWSTEWRPRDDARIPAANDALVRILSNIFASAILLDQSAKAHAPPKALTRKAKATIRRTRFSNPTGEAANVQIMVAVRMSAMREAHERAFSFDRLPKPGGRPPSPGLDHVVARCRDIFEQASSLESPFGCRLRPHFPWAKVVANLLDDVSQAGRLVTALGAKNRPRAITVRALRLS